MRAGTIVASNYLEMAKLLGESFLAHHPGDTFVILVVDDAPVADVPQGIEIQRLADLDLSDAEVDMMKTIYDVMELSTAVKPSLLRGLLRDDEVVCYLDPDIFVYSPFGDLLEPVRTCGIVLTPHVLEPIPRDGCDPTERTIMQSGIFNLGFIAVGRSAGPFLDWWQQRLMYDAIVDLEVGLFTDQRWIDWVPGLFDYQKCTDPGMNIAWWNIHERDLQVADDGTPNVGGEPVRFVHFSGYDPGNPDILSKHQHPRPRTTHDPGTAIRRLAEAYGTSLIERGHTERRFEPYRWTHGADGLPLTRLIRRLVRFGVVAEHIDGIDPAEMSTPFAFGESSGELRSWLESVDGGTDDFPVSRLERALWSSRIDLRLAFADIDGADAQNYRTWLRTEPSVVDDMVGLAPALPDDHPPAQPSNGTPLSPYLRARRLAGRSVRYAQARLQR